MRYSIRDHVYRTTKQNSEETSELQRDRYAYTDPTYRRSGDKRISLVGAYEGDIVHVPNKTNNTPATIKNILLFEKAGQYTWVKLLDCILFEYNGYLLHVFRNHQGCKASLATSETSVIHLWRSAVALWMLL